MNKITFITGNANKAEQLSKYLDMSVNHHKLDLDEIQSLNLQTVLEHKVKQAYKELNSPVIVDDVAIYIKELGGFPGPLIKWFAQAMPYSKICELLNKLDDQSARVECGIGFYDGKDLEYFFGEISGKVAPRLKGENGFGWDVVFIPEGYDITRAEMNEEDYDKTSPRRLALEKLKIYLDSETSSE